MKIERVTLRQIGMPLVHFFETSFGRTYERDIVIVEVVSGDISGWGEVTAGENPFYNEEWTDSAWLIARDYVAPRVLHHPFESATQVADRTSHIRGHRMACGGVEAALSGCGEAWRGGEARNHNGDLGVGNCAGGNGIGDGEEVGAASGKENAEVAHGLVISDQEWPVIMHRRLCDRLL